MTESVEFRNWFERPGSDGCDGGTLPLWTAATKKAVTGDAIAAAAP